MINLSQETEALAKRLAAALSLSVEDAIRLALEEKARAVVVVMEPRVTQGINPPQPSPPATPARIDLWRSLRPCRFSIRAPRTKSWTILTPYDCRR